MSSKSRKTLRRSVAIAMAGYVVPFLCTSIGVGMFEHESTAHVLIVAVSSAFIFSCLILLLVCPIVFHTSLRDLLRLSRSVSRGQLRESLLFGITCIGGIVAVTGSNAVISIGRCLGGSLVTDAITFFIVVTIVIVAFALSFSIACQVRPEK
jgi:hypothetical protein